VILGGWPYPLDLRARAPRLKWFHQRPAGASNLLLGDLWGSDVMVTTSRGAGNTLAIAEYAVAGILHFAKGFHRAGVDREQKAFDYRAYRPLLLEGKTACVVGAGGIGLEIGRLCAALGMRVVGTRRRGQADASLPTGFAALGGPQDLDRFLATSDFVAIACQWTPETTRLFDADRFAAMKAGSVLVNVARGEIVDEEALADALGRGHLRGAVLDVFVGEFEHPPSQAPVVGSARADHAACLGRQRPGSSCGDRGVLREPCRLARPPSAAQRHRLGTRVLASSSRTNRSRTRGGIVPSRAELRRRFLAALWKELRIVWPILSGLLGMQVAFGLVIGLVERWSMGNALYFTFVTGLTIGYGDLVPSQFASRLLAVAIGFVGILLTALIAGRWCARAQRSGRRRDRLIRRHPVAAPRYDECAIVVRSLSRNIFPGSDCRRSVGTLG